MSNTQTTAAGEGSGVRRHRGGSAAEAVDFGSDVRFGFLKKGKRVIFPKDLRGDMRYVRILPSRDINLEPTNAQYATSVAPYRDAASGVDEDTKSEAFTSWFVFALGYKYFGFKKEHILSPRLLAGFETDPTKCQDAIHDVYELARRGVNGAWQALTEADSSRPQGGFGGNKYQSAVLPRASQFAVVDAVTCTSKNPQWVHAPIILAQGGLRQMKTALTHPPRVRARDGKWPSYFLGDVTDPTTGICGYLLQVPTSGGHANDGRQPMAWTISFSSDPYMFTPQDRELLVPLNPDILKDRHEFTLLDDRWTSFNFPEYQAVVDYMIEDPLIPNALIKQACGAKAKVDVQDDAPTFASAVTGFPGAPFGAPPGFQQGLPAFGATGMPSGFGGAALPGFPQGGAPAFGAASAPPPGGFGGAVLPGFQQGGMPTSGGFGATAPMGFSPPVVGQFPSSPLPGVVQQSAFVSAHDASDDDDDADADTVPFSAGPAVAGMSPMASSQPPAFAKETAPPLAPTPVSATPPRSFWVADVESKTYLNNQAAVAEADLVDVIRGHRPEQLRVILIGDPSNKLMTLQEAGVRIPEELATRQSPPQLVGDQPPQLPMQSAPPQSAPAHSAASIPPSFIGRETETGDSLKARFADLSARAKDPNGAPLTPAEVTELFALSGKVGS